MADRLSRAEDWASGLLSHLTSAQRARLAKELAAELRRRQSRRIAEARNPDGSRYTPRKPQARRKKGRIRRAMFSKLRTARFLKTASSADASVLHFTRDVERIARVHQEGLRDRVQRNGPIVQYPARELLGLADADVKRIADIVLDFLAR
ncbi:phage virion morphogenesis protein [Burkholderia multivorans]|uniref:phage virion morphogenesis protein n=1 Tax=Burkholderia multivorans TaxID=87883 RepID=UPI000758428D|nr:phage virion morphogenesis protein [Burkholderia multivorans]KVS13664.1 virion morphogenesis protein [Burkholderia multivorans]MBU9229289.1 phage virion morphogenesis protein [Burkholderia multivorans]MBU9289895.1 phage virion morphogenesis protein [Burkholderia multivorans]MBU9365468.1 phage virion morphogenesis protein [Burkholderia multivorans]MBU9490291.1 phage virion morphogenesis protein [Burkholderia multivorans]